MTGLGRADGAAELQRDLVLGDEQEHGNHREDRDGDGEHVAEARQAHTAPLTQVSGPLAPNPAMSLGPCRASVRRWAAATAPSSDRANPCPAASPGPR